MRGLPALDRFLRSRSLAVGLIVLVGVLSAIGTVPGNESFYGSPLFVLPLALLTLATAACAWERTAGARRLAADPGSVSDALANRLREHPQIVVPAGDLTADDVVRHLRTARMHVRSGPTLVAGWAGRAGLLGSPLFHWSLVALFVVIVLGQATASSGLIGVPAGSSVVERAESYGKLETGPLFLGHTRLELGVAEWRRTLVVDGIDRGPVPTVTIARDGRELERELVYANRPLRHGTMLVHMNDWGLAADVSIETSGGEALDRFPVLVDFADDTRSATRPARVEYADSAGRRWRLSVRLVPPADGRPASNDTSTAADAIIEARAVTTGPGTPQDAVRDRLSIGEDMSLPDGNILRFNDATPYARLSVVRDWSVWPIYTLLVTATIGLALSLLLPYRAIWVLVTEREGERRLHIVHRHIRRERLFAETIAESLTTAAEKGTQE